MKTIEMIDGINIRRIKKRLWYVVLFEGAEILFKSRERAIDYLMERA